MPSVRDQNGTWSLVIVDENDRATQERSNSSYLEALPRYMTLFDPAFTKAKEQSEYAFLETLLGVRGLQDAGWNPYETSFEVIDEMCALHAKAETFNAKRHLELWLYWHVVAAWKPYETIANLIDISLGGAFDLFRFPPNDRGAHPSPGVKIDRLREAAQAARMPDL